MTDLRKQCAEVLREARFKTFADGEALVFESDTVLGFLFVYETCPDLIGRWRDDAAKVIRKYQFGLRVSGQKAWNTYLVLLAREQELKHQPALTAIEEDLSATRKIARAGLRDSADVREALLPLLPLQAAPRLEAVDMREEVRQRATELPQRVLDAFLSGADDAAIVQALEEDS